MIGLRVDLSSCPTFADLIQSLWVSLQADRCHSHYSFSDVASEVSILHIVIHVYIYCATYTEFTDENFILYVII